MLMLVNAPWLNLKERKMCKKKNLREWETPMNLTDTERKLYGMTTSHQLNKTAKKKKDDN